MTSDRTALAGGVLVGTAVAVTVSGWLAVPTATAAAIAMFHLLRRGAPATDRRDQLRTSADLPFAVDLLVAAVRAGAPTVDALAEVADVFDGPLSGRLRRVAAALDAGVEPADAWSYLADVPGSERVVRAALRSADSGAALATTLTRAAADLRSMRSARAEAAVRRAATLSVLPLGLCFLPAFLLAGVLPVLVAVLGDFLH